MKRAKFDTGPKLPFYPTGKRF